MSNARLLRRADVPPLPEDAPVDKVAAHMAELVEQTGYLQHAMASIFIAVEFGQRFTYDETVYDKHGKPMRDRRGRIVHTSLIHPDVLRAFKRLTLKTVVWEKDARAWRKRLKV